jgi:acyl-CoA synthetase (AMP-forming)/AMP-acid ligase II
MQVEAGALVRQTAERYGDRGALTSRARSMSFAELNLAANRVGSALLQLRARRGDRVGVLAYNTPEVVEAWFGFEKHNLVRAVLHSHFPVDAHVASLNHIEASTLIFDTRFTEQLDTVRGQLTSVQHLAAIGPDTPDWATPFADLEAGGDPEDPYLDVDEDAPCFLQLTSGTTGQPKAWVKTYRS